MTLCGLYKLCVWQLLSTYQLQQSVAKQELIISIIKSMLQFIEIGVQMFGRQLVIRPHNGTFKQAPHALYGFSVNVPAFKARTCSRTPKIISVDAAKLARPGGRLGS